MPKADAIPEDFQLTVDAAGNTPGSDGRTVVIGANGRCQIIDRADFDHPEATVRALYLTEVVVARLVEVIDELEVWSAESRDSGYLDGDRVAVSIVARGRKHQVLLRNCGEPAVDGLVTALNQLLPEEARVFYNALRPEVVEAMRAFKKDGR